MTLLQRAVQRVFTEKQALGRERVNEFMTQGPETQPGDPSWPRPQAPQQPPGGLIQQLYRRFTQPRQPWPQPQSPPANQPTLPQDGGFARPLPPAEG